MIDRQLSSDDRRARHAEVASALERRSSDDAALLFTHHAGAGNGARAAIWAIAAAERSEQQLAFDQAARFYRAALAQDRSAIDAGRALARLAEALANAGRGPQSAAAFEEAAAEANASDAEALYQRAAEQYLVCGRIADGRRVLLPLLASHGVRYPTTTAGSLLLTLAYLPKLALRFLRGDANAGEPSQELLLRIDACNRAARGTVVVDPVRATYFSVRGLMDALRCGDGFRIGRTLCFVGTTLAPLAGPASRLAKPMLARAERIASEVRDARLDGMIRVSKAQVAFVAGDFASMLELCDAGARLLAEDGRGVRWDWDVAQMGAMRALEELGRADEIQRRLPGLIDQALSLEDLYAEVTFRLYDGFWRIARGDIEQARATARWVVERWGGAGFQLQHLYALRIEACCDVYERAQRTGWNRLEEAWPAIRRSGLLAHRMLRSDALALRARLALAAGGDVEREVEGAARSFDRMQRPDAIASACMLRAALSSRRGDRAGAVARLARAEASYARASMALHGSYARRRRGELTGGDEGDALVWEADRALHAAGIKSPDRWLELHAPGFGSAVA